MSFQERQKTENHSDQQGSHLKAYGRYFVYSRLSGLQPDVVVVVTSSFSDSIVFAVHTGKTAFKQYRFQIVPLWRAFSKRSVFADRFRRCSVDGSRIRNKTVSFSFENGVVWTGSEFGPEVWNSWSMYRMENVRARLQQMKAWQEYYENTSINCISKKP